MSVKTNIIHRIITHPGNAHRDDFLSVCIALARNPTMTVFRREPTNEELNGPEVLVLDVGMRHEPELNNFDHHQLERNAPAACALSMYVEYLGLSDSFALQAWYETTKTLDAKGPFATAKELELNKFPFELMSPTEDILLDMFSEYSNERVADSTLLYLMKEIGARMLRKVLALSKEYAEAFAKVRNFTVRDVEMLVWENKHSSTSMTLLQRKEFSEAAISICPDDRGPGWILYRYNDHPRVDFFPLDDKEDIVFAHKGGFIAKTQQMPIGKAIELAKLGII